MNDQPTGRMEPATAHVQPDTSAATEPGESADGENPSTLAPGLLMFNAESDNACTDDGCMVTFTTTKG